MKHPLTAGRFRTSLVAALALLAAPAHAQSESSGADPAVSTGAQPSRAECLDAHQAAQSLKQSGQFLEAQEKLSVCSSGSCPGAIISDCGQWITDLEQMTPSMVFDVRLDGKQATEAKLFVDGEPVAQWSKAHKVNPGRHVVRVELEPFEPREETLVLPEGQRMRLVAVEFHSPRPPEAAQPAPLAPAPPLPEPRRPTPVVVYPLLGVGVAGLASFGVFSVLGKSRQKDLEERCQPECTDSDIKPMKHYYLIGDVSAGVGAAALLGAAVIYLARPTEHTPRTGMTFGVGPADGDWRSLAISAKRTF